MKHAGSPVGHSAAQRRDANGIWLQPQRALRAAKPNPAERAAQPYGPKGAGEFGSMPGGTLVGNDHHIGMGRGL
ncbi:hypothetical protein [Parasedimentitalea huanghaiensis]|uniref:Uncharacterized protein n=1 Tax=Parasedimentitalea huanghaiensis TaxID=2682100 RepID=A0A6L6WLN0_9RHOB|nr:hypothetical protein [Zongyanglinia huanghaiensis]MVO17525.1 hypothetical protein [Zongyanglinia huanghaiensis]